MLIRGAIDGMLAALDPHSAYLDGAALERLETMIDGNYQGLGISVQMDDGAVKVVSPFKGSPADQAGIKAGDYITHIDGKLIYGLELDEAVKQMRGPAGSAIQLSIFRPGRDEPFDVIGDARRDRARAGHLELEARRHRRTSASTSSAATSASTSTTRSSRCGAKTAAASPGWCSTCARTPAARSTRRWRSATCS